MGTMIRVVRAGLAAAFGLSIAFGPAYAQLPAGAQDAIDKGVIAAKVPDYLLAVRYFEDARKLAPDAPVVYLNLGLAESRIPGRELRAIAWFGAYLTAYSNAPNASVVKEQILSLRARNTSNLLRFIATLQKVARQNANLRDAAILWAEVGDLAEAHKAADLTSDADWKRAAQTAIAEGQVDAGDRTGARETLAIALKTSDLIVDMEAKAMGQALIAKVQIRAGDSAGAVDTLASALRSADLIQSTRYRSHVQGIVAVAQFDAGDHAGARKTIESIQDVELKRSAIINISRESEKMSAASKLNREILPARCVAGPPLLRAIGLRYSITTMCAAPVH